jgi:hypothetical protein
VKCHGTFVTASQRAGWLKMSRFSSVDVSQPDLLPVSFCLESVFEWSLFCFKSVPTPSCAIFLHHHSFTFSSNPSRLVDRNHQERSPKQPNPHTVSTLIAEIFREWLLSQHALSVLQSPPSWHLPVSHSIDGDFRLQQGTANPWI